MARIDFDDWEDKEVARVYIAGRVAEALLAEKTLSEHGIDVSAGALPEQVRLPDPDAIREFLNVTETRILPETASPLAHAVMILTIGAMPILAGERPVLDGTG